MVKRSLNPPKPALLQQLMPFQRQDREPEGKRLIYTSKGFKSWKRLPKIINRLKRHMPYKRDGNSEFSFNPIKLTISWPINSLLKSPKRLKREWNTPVS